MTGVKLPRGFASASREMIRDMEKLGWVFRVSSGNHAIGKAPDGVTTIAVPRSLDAPNRGWQNAKAEFQRWLRVQAETEGGDLALVVKGMDAYADEENPMLAEIIAGGVTRHLERVLSDAGPQIVREGPWLARKKSGREGGERYESGAVLERVWSDGSIDYACSFHGCPFAAETPRSVSSHYGPTHTAKGEGVPWQEAIQSVVPDASYTEPASHREYHPTDRLRIALAEWLASQTWNGVNELAVLLLTWVHDRPDLGDPETMPVRELTPEEIVYRIRLLVGQPLAVRVESLEARLREEELTVEHRTAERDHQSARLAKVQGDLIALKDMMASIGQD